MSSTALGAMGKALDAVEDVQRWQRLVVEPVVSEMEKRLEAMLQPLVDLPARVVKLEGNQKKALLGWGVFATGTAGGMSYAWNWIKQHFHVS